MVVRWIFIISQLVWVALLNSVLPIFFLLMFNMIVLLTQGFPVSYLVKSLKLLLWLWVPILLFHGFFTPGTLIQQPVYLPLSIEGLQQGLYLSAHIGVIFFTAMLVLRVFSKEEWLILLQRLPFFSVVHPYIQMVLDLRPQVTLIFMQQKQIWEEKNHHWLALPDLFIASIKSTLEAGKKVAYQLWQNWDARMQPISTDEVEVWSVFDARYMLFLIIGWGLFWLM